MVAKPVLTVLKPLLENCLTSGTKAHEDGLTVSIEREKDEEIYFFRMDCVEGNSCLGMKKVEKEKCCDYLVFFNNLIFVQISDHAFRGKGTCVQMNSQMKRSEKLPQRVG